MTKQLKLWNGRAWCVVNFRDPLWPLDAPVDNMKVYACGESRADIMRMMAEYCGVKPPLSEIVSYGAERWGLSMDGVKPERGLWIRFGLYEAPVRVWPAEARLEPFLVKKPSKPRKNPKRAKKRI